MSIFWFSLCFIIKNTSANSKIFDFYFLLVEYWNITYIFTLILSTMKRKIENEHQFCFSDNVAVCDMSKFFCFRRKSKNWIWKIAIHVQSLFFGQNTTIVHRTTQEGGGGVHSYGNFFSLAPSPQIHFPPCAERFFFGRPPPPSPPTLHFSGKEEAGNSRLPRSYFSKHERLQCWVHKGSCNNSKKNTVRGELISKRKISQQERP